MKHVERAFKDVFWKWHGRNDQFLGFLDAVARHNLSKDVIDKEAVEKVNSDSVSI